MTVTSNYGGGATASGEIYVPKTPIVRTYDLDGNLTQDGRWSYTWDGENRLIEMKTISGVPLAAERRLEFEYDYQGRRIRKKVYDRATGGTLLSDIKFVYDGWNVIAELNGSDTLLQTYVWGLDLSGSYSGAGGVGGLLKIEDHGTGGEGHYVAYDGNGNVVALVSESTGALTARYEYGPFGEQVRATGPMALENPFQFSTKAVDLESGFYYYGMRYYNPTTGRWISRDPIGEEGGLNLYGFVGNDPLGLVDPNGEQSIEFPRGFRGWSKKRPSLEPNSADARNVHYSRNSITLNFHSCCNCEGILDDIYSDLKSFKHWGNNPVANLNLTGDIGSFHPGLGIAFLGLFAGNDPNWKVQFTFDDSVRCVSARTLDNHPLVGVRTWCASLKEEGPTCRITVATEGYEYPRNWRNLVGTTMGPGYDAQRRIWESYLGNIAESLTGNFCFDSFTRGIPIQSNIGTNDNPLLQ